MDTNEQWAAALAKMRASIKQQLAQELAQEFNASLGKLSEENANLTQKLKEAGQQSIEKIPEAASGQPKLKAPPPFAGLEDKDNDAKNMALYR